MKITDKNGNVIEGTYDELSPVLVKLMTDGVPQRAVRTTSTPSTSRPRSIAVAVPKRRGKRRPYRLDILRTIQVPGHGEWEDAPGIEPSLVRHMDDNLTVTVAKGRKMLANPLTAARSGRPTQYIVDNYRPGQMRVVYTRIADGKVLRIIC